jgi:hypothetical protein
MTIVCNTKQSHRAGRLGSVQTNRVTNLLSLCSMVSETLHLSLSVLSVVRPIYSPSIKQTCDKPLRVSGVLSKN